jgi:O-antigen/teichoic acid export membrane protein
MSPNLKNKAIRGVKWTIIEAIGLRGVQFVVGIILARLLQPEQFGLIGMLLIFMALAQVFLDSGFGAALIQKQDITQKDISSIFYFNILVGFIAAICLCGIAPWVAKFYNQPILTPLLRLMSVVLVINSFGLVQNVLLRKALDFKTETKVSLVASMLSGIVGVTMAYSGFGVWSLIGQQLSAAVFRTSLLWFFTSWRPIWVFSLQSLKSMFGFGSKVLFASLLNTFFDNIYYLVIGKLFSPTALGYYTRADNLQQLPSNTLAAMVSRVTFPVFSTIPDDSDRIKRGMTKALTMLALVNFPLMIGLAVVARPLVIVLLTDTWQPCVPYLQLLCIVGLIFPLHLINLNILQAMGRSDMFLRLEVIKKTMVALAIMITWHFGIMAMITGQVAVSFVGYYLTMYYNKKLLQYSIWGQIKDLFPYLINALLMGLVIYMMNYIQFQNILVSLLIETFVGFVVYVGLCWLLKLPVFLEIWKMGWRRVRLFV